MEMEKASAIQKPSRLGQPQVRSGEPRGTGSISLLDSRLPSVPIWAFSDRSCNRCRRRCLVMLSGLSGRKVLAERQKGWVEIWTQPVGFKTSHLFFPSRRSEKYNHGFWSLFLYNLTTFGLISRVQGAQFALRDRHPKRAGPGCRSQAGRLATCGPAVFFISYRRKTGALEMACYQPPPDGA